MRRAGNKDKRCIILISLLGSGLGELMDGPAFIATQAAIPAEEPTAGCTVSLQLPVKPVNGRFGPVANAWHRKGGRWQISKSLRPVPLESFWNQDFSINCVTFM
jgi:hypothetical protein